MALSLPTHRVSRVLNSAAAGRRLALRAVAYQMVAVVLVALVFLVQGWSASLAALLGGASVVLGGALAANVALGGGVVPARSAFLRLLLGTGLKWAVVITIFAMALRWAHGAAPFAGRARGRFDRAPTGFEL